jgi:hypothetical protein
MSIASIAVRSSNVTINQAQWQLLCTAGVKCRILEVSYIGATATAASVGWGRPAANAVTPGTTSTFQRDDSADPACVTTVSLTYGTSPTNPTNFHRRWNGAATIGVGIVYTFPRGIIIPVSGTFTCANVTAGVVADHNLVIDE